jgi:hypothetical protein
MHCNWLAALSTGLSNTMAALHVGRLHHAPGCLPALLVLPSDWGCMLAALQEGSLQQLQAAEQQLAAAQATTGSPTRGATTDPAAAAAGAAALAPPAEASVPAGSLLQAQQQVLDALGTASRASQQLQAALNDNHALQQQLVELRAAALQQQGSGPKLQALCERLQVGL